MNLGVSQSLVQSETGQHTCVQGGRVPLGCRVVESAYIWATKIKAVQLIDKLNVSALGRRQRRGPGCVGFSVEVAVARGGWRCCDSIPWMTVLLKT